MSLNMKKVYQVIMKDGLRDYRYLNSKIKPINYSEENKGFIAGFRSKEMLHSSKGFIMTSYEALLDNQDNLTHWTPNPYITLSYKDSARLHVQGHEEEKIRQINTFVIDIDNRTVNENDILLACLNLGFTPTLVLKTDRGHQVYFVLKNPVYVTAKSGFKSLKVAKKVAISLKNALKKTLPVDVLCNDFGICRFPTSKNIEFFEASFVYDFSRLLTWSLKQSDNETNSNKKMTLRKSPSRQIDEPWFDMLLHQSAVKGSRGIMGRNNIALTLALAMYSSGQSKETCLFNLTEFNARLAIPLKESELNRTIESAYSGKYEGAKRSYITSLCQEWVASDLEAKDLFKTASWYKFKKQRSERKNSHLNEWREDLLNYMHKVTDNVKTHVRITRKQLMEALNIPSATLSRLMNSLEKDKFFQIERFMGRDGGYRLALTQNVVVNELKAKKKESKEILATYLGSTDMELLVNSPAKSTKQIGLFELDTG
ncbi:primase C-terminal domain-containing protein [Ligilactobacillus salivarius]|uniref:primase C-terminal domain-containing protein n=1 Tax=Ligilactobacillus salivarius TaxID=1624 RepID=UPI001CBCACE6|nr:primase C-terminal domain-containing protein [Ligilactobacillus salivarius]MBZ4031111.1 primase C-terminal domain-containing protein [Ligilactobacillus salivarius]